AEVLRAMERGRAEGLVRREAALDEHPDFPVRGEAGELAVGAHLAGGAGVDEVADDAGGAEVVVLLIRALRAAAGAGVDDGARGEGKQALVGPDIGLVVPVVLAGDAAEGDAEGGGVAALGGAPEL